MRVMAAMAASAHAGYQRLSCAKVSDHAHRQKYSASAYTAVKKNENGNTAISQIVLTATSRPTRAVVSRSTAFSPNTNDTDETINAPMKNACSRSWNARNGSDTIHDTHE